MSQAFPDPQVCDAGSQSAPLRIEPMSTACWEIDVSAVRALIDAIAGGATWHNWVAALLYGARIADVSERGLQLVGSPDGRDGLIGQPVACFCPPESWATFAELIVAVASDRPDHAARSRGVSSFMFRNAVITIWGAAGDTAPNTLWVCVSGEIDDDRSFWAVYASEQRYCALIHHLPVALLQVDSRAMGAVFYELRSEGVMDLASYLEGRDEMVRTACQVVRVTVANQGAARLFGTSIDALVRQVDFVFRAAPDAARRVMIAHFDGKRSHVERMKVERFDGRQIDVELTVTFPTPPERLDVTLLTLEDITDRLRTEAQLRQLQTDYSHAARIATLGELASSIAHEVNQPLAAIAMNAETSLRWLSRDEPNLAKVAALTTRVAESAHHASEIVHRIRAMAARHVPERVLLDLNDVVHDALLFVRHDLETRSIGLSLSLAAGLPRILGDRVQLQQVIVNFLVNSLQAIAQCKGAGRIEIGTGVDEKGAVHFSIRDNGPGIAPENLDRVFDGFFTTKHDGVGIGLAICQSIIGAHGGRIVAANHPGGGALFSFALPGSPAPVKD